MRSVSFFVLLLLQGQSDSTPFLSQLDPKSNERTFFELPRDSYQKKGQYSCRVQARTLMDLRAQEKHSYVAEAGYIAGKELLVQAKSLPSEAEFKKANEKLDANPVDPDANTVAGKYLAFVTGDYAAAMPFLVNSGDKTLKALADHELDATYIDTAVKKVGMGDEWVLAAKKFPALSKLFYDRAAQWYGPAWFGLDGVWKDRTRVQLRKLLQNQNVADPKSVTAPSGWKVNDATAKAGPTTKTAHAGKVDDM